jgi:hypothetical protein
VVHLRIGLANNATSSRKRIEWRQEALGTANETRAREKCVDTYNLLPNAIAPVTSL